MTLKGLEAVNRAPKGIFALECIAQLLDVEICREVSEPAVRNGKIRPQFIASVEKIIHYREGVNSIERGIVHTNIVEADMVRLIWKPRKSSSL